MTEIGALPNEWEVVKFVEVCNKIQSGGTPLTSVKDYYNGKIPFVKIEDITNSKKYLTDTKIKISKEGLDNSSAWLVPKDSLLLAIYGSLGSVAINKIELATNQAILGIISNKDKADIEFLYYFFNNAKLAKYAKQTTQANLTAEIIKNLQIPLPPLSEQRRIAEVLGTVDSAIEKVGGAIEKTERLKKGLMQRLLTRGIGHERFKESEVGRIPEEWEVVQLKEVVISYRNGIYKPREFYGIGYPSIRMYNITNGRVNTAKAPLLQVTEQELQDYGLEEGDIVINRVNAAELVGRAGVVPKSLGKVTFESKNIRLRLNKNKVFSDFLSVFVQTPAYAEQIRSQAKIAVHQATITQDDIGAIIFPLPPLPEQRRIAEILSAADAKLALERRRKEKLERIKKGLMNELLTGRKRIKVADKNAS